MALLLRLEQHH
jgi:hypothetical protein